MQEVVKKVKVPLVIDSTDEKVMEEALKFSQGKAIINSINLEDGEERFDAVMPLVKKYGASIVIGTIDEIGMAVTREKKLEVAKRSYDLLTQKMGYGGGRYHFRPTYVPSWYRGRAVYWRGGRNN